MGYAWTGDWIERISEFARREGYDHIWSYLVAHPGTPLVEIAERIGDAAALQIETIAMQWCLSHAMMGAFIRDSIARNINHHLPEGWGLGDELARVQAIVVGGIRREPYAKFCAGIGTYLLKLHPPPVAWLPASSDDPILLAAYDHALATLTDDERTTMELGKFNPRPGDIYGNALNSTWESISIYDGPEVFLEQFQAVRQKLGHLFATHWCQSEVCNGGFHQFFSNSTGVLAPEAAEGFDAIGMPKCAAIVRQAMSFFEGRYPRERAPRVEILRAQAGATREEWDPFFHLDDTFYEYLDSENGGFPNAADAYATQSGLAG